VNLDQKQPAIRRRAAALLSSAGVPFRIVEQDTYSVVKRVIPEGGTMCSLCSRLRRGVLYRVATRDRRDQDRARPPPRRRPRDVLPEPLLRRQAEDDAAEARLRRRPPRRDPAARLRARARPRPLRELSAFPIIPCNLCGSQQHLQRRQVGEMLREWEKKHPAGIESIYNALAKVVRRI
jgi:tRNA 2-thiocytidine biosynthesis protein TtcA